MAASHDVMCTRIHQAEMRRMPQLECAHVGLEPLTRRRNTITINSRMRLGSTAVRRAVACALPGFASVGLLYASNATACGQGGSTLVQLLPLADAGDVPLNAALIVSSNGAEPEIRLVRLRNDAASLDVPVEVTCQTTNNGKYVTGALCVARALLEPETDYIWTVRGPNLNEASRRFTTGSATATSSLLNGVVAQLTDSGLSSTDCGDYNYATVEFDTAHLQRPTVAMLGAPRYPGHAHLLMATSGVVQVHFYGLEGCSNLELLDELGTSTVVGEYCFEKIDQPEPSAPVEPDPIETGVTEGSDTRLPTADGRGCSFAPVRSNPSAWLLVLLLGCFVRLRGSPRTDASIQS